MNFEYGGVRWSSDDYSRIANNPNDVLPSPPKLNRQQYDALSSSDRDRYEAIRRLHAQYLTNLRRSQQSKNTSGNFDGIDRSFVGSGIRAINRSLFDIEKRLQKKIDDAGKSGNKVKDATQYSQLLKLIRSQNKLGSSFNSNKGEMTASQWSSMLEGYKAIDKLSSNLDDFLLDTSEIKTLFKKYNVDAQADISNRTKLSYMMEKIAKEAGFNHGSNVNDRLKDMHPSSLSNKTEGTAGITSGLLTAGLGALGPAGQLVGMLLNTTGGLNLAEKGGAGLINMFRKRVLRHRFEEDDSSSSSSSRSRSMDLEEDEDLSEEQIAGDSVIKERKQIVKSVERATKDTLANGIEEGLKNAGPTVAQILKDAYTETADDFKEDFLDGVNEGIIDSVNEEIEKLGDEQRNILQGLDLTGDLIEELRKSGFSDDDARQMAGGIAQVVKESLDSHSKVVGASVEDLTQELKNQEAPISYEDQRDLDIRSHKQQLNQREIEIRLEQDFFSEQFAMVIDPLEKLLELAKKGKLGGGGSGGIIDTTAKVLGGAGLVALLAKVKSFFKGAGAGAGAGAGGIRGAISNTFKTLRNLPKGAKLLGGASIILEMFDVAEAAEKEGPQAAKKAAVTAAAKLRAANIASKFGPGPIGKLISGVLGYVAADTVIEGTEKALDSTAEALGLEKDTVSLIFGSGQIFDPSYMSDDSQKRMTSGNVWDAMTVAGPLAAARDKIGQVRDWGLKRAEPFTRMKGVNSGSSSTAPMIGGSGNMGGTPSIAPLIPKSASNISGLTHREQSFLTVQDAASATGMDPQLMLQMAAVESNFNARAKNGTGSSASGLFQFIKSTWLSTFDRYGAKYGYDPSSMSESEKLALRFDPMANSLMGAELTRENASIINSNDPGLLYLAHFLGPDRASAVLRNPNDNLHSLLPSQVFAQNPHMRNMRTGQDLIDWAQSVMRGKASVVNSLATSISSKMPTTEAVAISSGGGVSPSQSITASSVSNAAQGKATASTPQNTYNDTAQIPSTLVKSPDVIIQPSPAVASTSNSQAIGPNMAQDSMFMLDDPGTTLVNSGVV